MHDEFRKRWASVNLPEIIEAAWDDMPVWVDGRPTDGEIFFSDVTFVNCAHCHRITSPLQKKVVFTCICGPESLFHPSAVSDVSSYFQSRLFLLIDEQTPGCERNVLFKQHQWPEQCLKWDRGPEELSHTSRQKKCWQGCVWNSVCICPLSPPWHPSHTVGCFS